MVNAITIYNYRNISQAKIDTENKINVLIEKNGYGKTNFLEAIYYTVFGNSFRQVNSTKELLGQIDNNMKVKIEVENINLELAVQVNGQLTKSLKLNDKRIKQSSVIEKLPIILFAPHSVDLTSGQPSVRRTDLDNFLSITNPIYFEAIKKYTTVLKNRNSLIKAIQARKSNSTELEFWTKKISELSAFIYKERLKFFASIKETIKEVSEKIYHDVSDLSVNYIPNFQIIDPDKAESEIYQKYLDNTEKEIIVGKTLYGIHKDDYNFAFVSPSQALLELKFHGSRGQQRIGSFIFKIAQLELLENDKKQKTLLLFDDLMSELDNTHRENIGEFLINQSNQIILTGADMKEIPENLQKNAKFINFTKV